MADDLGWQDTSLPLADYETPLNRRYRTPNIVRMAADGMKFTNAYAAGPVCSPTRVTLMTGRFPAETRVTVALGEGGPGARSRPSPVLLSPPWNVNGLSPVAGTPQTFAGPLLPQILRDAGYRTIHVGKGHWGAIGTPGADPHALGFEVNIGGSAAGSPGSYHGQENYASAAGKDNVPHLEAYYGTDTFLTEALTLEANKAIDKAVAEGRPFFLHFAHFAPHTPLAMDRRFSRNYRISSADPSLNTLEIAYATLVEGMDKSLGDVLANVSRHGIERNTLVLFTSDNGASPESRIRPVDEYNAPLRRAKGSPYEGGLRVPLVIKWPGQIAPGTTNATPVITDDFFPTALAVGGVVGRERYVSGIRGVDLTPLLTGRGTLAADRPLLWHRPHTGGDAVGYPNGPFSALRVGSWKLIFHYERRHYELFDLSSDLSESQDVLARNAEVAGRLSRTLREALIKADAQMPLDPSTKAAVDLPPLIRP
jgi:arylsulfatase A-like enzyme